MAWRRLKHAVSRVGGHRLTGTSAPRMIYGHRSFSGSWLPRTRISSSVVFHENRRNVHIADNVFIWHYVILDGSDILTIEEGAQIGAWVGLFTHSSHIAIRLQGDRYFGWSGERPGWISEPLTIGAYAFIGAKASVLPGCDIGRAAVVSAHALVTRPVCDFAIVAGAPARVVGDVRELDAQHVDSASLWWSDYRAALGLQKDESVQTDDG
jgi:acetyltransferase-like isoleucine patch superfamily enzyme